MLFKIILLGLVCSGARALWNEEVGPWVEATKGELLPRARVRNVHENFFRLVPSNFDFRITGKSCDIVEAAIVRYKKIVENEYRIATKSVFPQSSSNRTWDEAVFSGELNWLEIDLLEPCEKWPYLGMDESYNLTFDEQSHSGILRAPKVWGILRGFESFSQLLIGSSDGGLKIQSQKISDSPRFPHRGLLLDTSRHFFPVSDILLTLEAMSYNKLNVFHWHIVDDNSFPFVSKTFPKLSEKGAYNPTMVYTPSEVQEVIEFARLLGIRVIPEFDTPAHSKSWGLAHPEILTECYANGKPNGKLGPMNPLKKALWKFLDGLFAEIFTTFPDNHVHLGGDEISFDCWASNPEIIQYMQAQGFGSDFKSLESEYFEKLLLLPKNRNISSIVWQEVYENVAKLPSDVVIQVWTGAWRGLMREIVSKNHSAILSACWYLSDLKSGGDWIKFYTCDPRSFSGTPEMKSRVLGGEACMWSEYVDRTNVHQRIWPRASAAAERLWSHERDTISEMKKRLEEHSCRMNRRGVPAQPPNGPGFCGV